MNHPCSIAALESALAGNLPAEEESSLHRHLEECAECSAALERMAGGKPWCEEAASLLARDQLDEGVPMREEWSAVDFTVEHLEPSDEPNVLGRLGGGAYDVLEVIGHGSMGVVLKAFDRELKRCVAIKVLAPHFAHSSLAKKRFAREAQAAAAVVHPQVLAIHQVQPAGPLPFLVMPFVVGESLAQRLANQGILELREILRIGTQVAAGLAAAHEQGLVHRDVKPANILLEKGVERAVLSDFGLARAADDVALTRWGVVAGTPQYMSPEQARGDALDGRSDLFSLGCVLYEMATGVSPFRADTMIATIRRLVEESPQAMGSLNPELPPWFIAIVNRLLEKEPSRRFGSAKEVSELLEGCLAHIQQPANVPLPPSLATHAARGRWIFNSRRRGVIAMLSALGIAVVGMVFFQASEAPEIAGKWTGKEWGEVVLEQRQPGEYEGTYTDTVKDKPGMIQVKWSRLEGRFKGTWREGKDRYGKISVRLVGDEIRGAWTTDEKSGIKPGTPELADLLWIRQARTATELEGDWRLEAITGGGVISYERGLTVRVRGNRWTIIRQNSEAPHRLVLNAGDNHQAIDLVVERDSRPPLLYRGLYHLRGDTLTIAWGPRSSIRPTDFDGVDGGVHTWKRINDEGSVSKRTTEPQENQARVPGTDDPSRTRPALPQAKTANAAPKLIRQIQTAHRIKAIACSADGKLIAVSNGEVTFPTTPDSKPTVTILDAETGKTVISLPLTTKEEDAVLAATEGLPRYEIGPLAFSPEGNVVAVGTGLGQVKLFNARTGEPIRSLDDEKEKLADKKTPEKLKTLKRAMGAVSALAFSPDGSLLAMCGSSFDDVGQNWGGIERLRLFTTGPGRLKVWEVKTGTLKFNLAGHSDADAIAFAPEGNYLASAGRWSGPDHGTGVIVWNLENGTKVRTLVKEANGGVRAVAFSPTRKIVAMAALNFDKENDTRSTSVSLAFALSGITEWQQTIPGWANPKAFLPDGKTVVVQCGEESIRFVNTETGVVRHEIKATDQPPGGRWSDFAIALKGNRLVIGGTDGEKKGFVAVWELGGASPGE